MGQKLLPPSISKPCSQLTSARSQMTHMADDDDDGFRKNAYASIFLYASGIARKIDAGNGEIHLDGSGVCESSQIAYEMALNVIRSFEQ